MIPYIVFHLMDGLYTIIHKKIDVETVSLEELLKQITGASQVAQIDDKELDELISQVLNENTNAVEEYKKGKVTVIMFLVGQVMKKAGKKIDAQIVKEKLERNLK